MVVELGLPEEDIKRKTEEWILGKQAGSVRKATHKEQNKEKRKVARQERWKRQQAEDKKFQKYLEGLSPEELERINQRREEDANPEI